MKLKIISILLISIPFVLFSQVGEEDEILNELTDYFPNKKLKIVELNADDLRKFINEQLDYSPLVKTYELNNKIAVLNRKSMEASFSPDFLLGLGTQGFDSYNREVVVQENVPIEWDDTNPIVSNIELPNGGQGLIWLPRPMAYGLRDIPLNASTKFFSRNYGSNVGFSYKFPFGLSINSLNYSMNWRQHPKTYGYPWNSSISTSFTMPLAAGLGFFGDRNRVNVEVMKFDEKINDENIKMYINSLKLQVATNFFHLHSLNKQLFLVDSLITLAELQEKDVDFMTEKQRIPLSENLSLRTKLRSLNITKETTINNIILYSNKLNLNTFKSEEVYYYRTEVNQLDSAINEMIARFYKVTSEERIDDLIWKHPSLEIQRYDMEQARLNLKYAENRKRPQINLNTSFSILETNQIGYDNPLYAAERVFTRPDNYQWNVGFQYVFPMRDVNELTYLSKKMEADMQHQQIESTERELSDALEHYIYSMKLAIDNINLNRKNLEAARRIYEETAVPLYEMKRLNNYDYYSYLSEVVSAELSALNAKSQLMQTFLSFAQDMNIYVDDILNNLE